MKDFLEELKILGRRHKSAVEDKKRERESSRGGYGGKGDPKGQKGDSGKDNRPAPPPRKKCPHCGLSNHDPDNCFKKYPHLRPNADGKETGGAGGAQPKSKNRKKKDGDVVDRFDEAGYIAQRVCLWGEPPLEPPPLVAGVPLFIRAITNSTYGHHGEMALPQMLVSDVGVAQ